MAVSRALGEAHTTGCSETLASIPSAASINITVIVTNEKERSLRHLDIAVGADGDVSTKGTNIEKLYVQLTDGFPVNGIDALLWYHGCRFKRREAKCVGGRRQTNLAQSLVDRSNIYFETQTQSSVKYAMTLARRDLTKDPFND